MSNTKLKFQVPSTSYSFSALDQGQVLATPTLRASTPIRSFGKFRLRLTSSQLLNITCNVTEDYYTFDNIKFGSKSFRVKLVNGHASVVRKPSYVGVIRGFVFCPVSKTYGDSYESYKVFSY